MSEGTTLTYSSYLHLDELLSLQQPRSDPPEHDEMIFLVTHQAYELWFKLQLHELEKIQRDFRANHLYGAIATFKRVRTIMKVMVEQVDILETLTPMSFSSFRDRLETASGFQSVQFREFEFLLGYKRADMLRFHQPGAADHERLVRRLNEPSVVDCFYDFLEQRGVVIPAALRARDVTLRTRGRVTSIAAFDQIVLANRNGYPVRLADVGYAEDGAEKAESIANVDGVPAVLLEVRKQSGTNTVAVVEAVKDRLGEIRSSLPAGYRMEVVRDQSIFLPSSLGGVPVLSRPPARPSDRTCAASVPADRPPSLPPDQRSSPRNISAPRNVPVVRITARASIEEPSASVAPPTAPPDRISAAASPSISWTPEPTTSWRTASR